MPPPQAVGAREGVRGERTEVTLHPAQSPGRGCKPRREGSTHKGWGPAWTTSGASSMTRRWEPTLL